MIELLPGSAYATRYVASHDAIGFAFDSQRGEHAIGNDCVRPFVALPNSLAFVPVGCDVLSESGAGGEYLRVIRTAGLQSWPDHPFNNRLDPQAVKLALRMRSALLVASVAADWEAWAFALAQRVTGHQDVSTPAKGSITHRRMRLLDEFIDEGFAGPLSVQAMADLLELSEGFFMRSFKLATGQSPHSYLIDRRVAKARARICDSTANLADIALACGFNSQAHMATTFKQRLGVTPMQLRLCSARAKSTE